MSSFIHNAIMPFCWKESERGLLSHDIYATITITFQGITVFCIIIILHFSYRNKVLVVKHEPHIPTLYTTYWHL